MTEETLRTTLSRIQWGFVLAILAGVVASAPLAGPHFVGSHDAFLSIYRGQMHFLAIQEGIFLPRWSPEFFFGYGYPLFNFLAPVPSLVVALLHGAGLPLPDAVELAFGLGAVGGSVGMWFWLRRLVGEAGAVAGAVAYTFAPFHIVDVYLRGGLPEFIAMTLFPWVLAALWPRANPWWRLGGTAVAFGALVLTHNVMAFIFAPMALAYALGWGVLRWRQLADQPRAVRVAGFLAPSMGLVLGGLLASFFWLPALLELGTVNPGNLTDNPFVDFRRYFDPQPISFSPIQVYGTWENGEWYYPVQAGLVQVLLALGGLLAAGLTWRRQGPVMRGHIVFAGAGIALCLFMTLGVSQTLWEILPLGRFIQFPWRFLGPLSVFTALGTALLLVPLALAFPWRRTALALGISLACIVAGMGGLTFRQATTDAAWTGLAGAQLFESLTNTIGTTSLAEYLPQGVTPAAVSSPIAHDRMLGRDIRWITSPGTIVLEADRGTHRQRFVLEREAAGPVIFPVVDFAGWEVRIGDQRLPHTASAQLGLVEAEIPAGVTTVDLVLAQTLPRRIGEFLSWASVIVLAWVLFSGVRQAGGIRLRNWSGLDERIGLTGSAALALTLAVMVPAWLIGRGQTPLAELGPPSTILASATQAGAASGTITFDWTIPPPTGTRVHLVAGGTGPVAMVPVPTGSATGQWQLPPGSPPGPYRLRLEPAGPDGPLTITGQAVGRYPLPSVMVDLPPFFLESALPAPPPAIVTDARHEAGMLDGMTLTVNGQPLPSGGAVRPGDVIEAAWHWTPSGTAPRNLVAFVHLLTPDGRLVAQADSQPLGGMYPTTAWTSGEAFVDRTRLPVPADVPAGEYELKVGLYDPVTLTRAPFTLANDSQPTIIPIAAVAVRP